MFILTLLQNLFLFLGYIANPNSFPKPLSPSEEAEYLRQMQEGDKKARDILIERNLRLVAHVVKKYNGIIEFDPGTEIFSVSILFPLDN